MSASPQPANASRDARKEGVVDTLRSATKDDFLIWDNRKHPLKVFETSTTEDGKFEVSVVGINNGRVSITENYDPSGNPNPRADNNENIENLRFATDEEVARGWGMDEAEKVNNGRSPRGREPAGPDGTVYDGDNSGGSGRNMATLSDGGPQPDMVVPEEMVERDDDGGFTMADNSGSADLVGDNGTPEAEGSEFDGSADEYAKERLNDPFATFDDMLEAMNAHGIFDDADSYFERESESTHTWVDELVAFGQDIPKAAGGWVLIDYGIVTDTYRRKLVWVNQKTDDLLALTAHRDEDSPWTYNVFRTPLDNSGELSPQVITNDPNEAIEMVRGEIYEGLNNVQIEFIEQRDGEVRVRSDVREASLGTRVMQRLGLDVRVPSARQTKQTLFDTIQPGVDWVQDNSEAVGSAILFSIEAAVAGLSKRFFGAELRPVIEPDELGFELDAAYKYNGQKADFVNVDASVTGSGASAQQIERILTSAFRDTSGESRTQRVERVAQEEYGMSDRKLNEIADEATDNGTTDADLFASLVASEIAGSAGRGARLTFDPSAFDIRGENSRLPEALDMELLTTIFGDRIGLNDISLQYSNSDGSVDFSENASGSGSSSSSRRRPGKSDPRDDSTDVPMSAMEAFTTADLAQKRLDGGGKTKNTAAAVVQAAEINDITLVNETDLGRFLRNANNDQREKDILEDQAIGYVAARYVSTGRDFNGDRSNSFADDHDDSIRDIIESSASEPWSRSDYFNGNENGTADTIERVVESANDLLENMDDGDEGGDDGDNDGGDDNGSGDGGEGGSDGGSASAIEKVQNAEEPSDLDLSVLREAANEGMDERMLNHMANAANIPMNQVIDDPEEAEEWEQKRRSGQEMFAEGYNAAVAPEAGTGDPDAGESYY